MRPFYCKEPLKLKKVKLCAIIVVGHSIKKITAKEALYGKYDCICR